MLARVIFQHLHCVPYPGYGTAMKIFYMCVMTMIFPHEDFTPLCIFG